MKFILLILISSLPTSFAEVLKTTPIHSVGFIQVQKGLSIKNLKMKAHIKCQLLDKDQKFLASQQLDLITILEKNPMYTGKSGTVELTLRGGKISPGHTAALFSSCEYKLNLESYYNKAKIKGSLTLFKTDIDRIENLNAFYQQDLLSSKLSSALNEISLIVKKNKITKK
jgi:hypothetical protein